jgi:hypothetical protein
MPRISMKLTASLVGSLALLLGAACERSTETTPEPAPGTNGVSQDPNGRPSQEPNSMRPTPSTATPGSTTTPGNTAAPGSTSAQGSSTRPTTSAPVENPDTVPVRGTDPDMQGGGAGGAAGHGGQSGHAGHGGKTNR